MKQGTSITILIVIVSAIAGGVCYLWGKNTAQSEAYYIEGKTNKVISHIKNTYPDQWKEIEASRPWIEYDIAKKER